MARYWWYCMVVVLYLKAGLVLVGLCKSKDHVIPLNEICWDILLGWVPQGRTCSSDAARRWRAGRPVTPAGEPRLAVQFLVVQQVNDIAEQLFAVAAYQDVGVTCNISDRKCKIDWSWNKNVAQDRLVKLTKNREARCTRWVCTSSLGQTIDISHLSSRQDFNLFFA